MRVSCTCFLALSRVAHSAHCKFLSFLITITANRECVCRLLVLNKLPHTHVCICARSHPFTSVTFCGARIHAASMLAACLRAHTHTHACTGAYTRMRACFISGIFLSRSLTRSRSRSRSRSLSLSRSLAPSRFLSLTHTYLEHSLAERQDRLEGLGAADAVLLLLPHVAV